MFCTGKDVVVLFTLIGTELENAERSVSQMQVLLPPCIARLIVSISDV
jgi:hypothetical protein